MTLQSAIEAELPFLRAEAEARMTDTFTAYGLPEWTKVDGLDTQTRLPQYDTPGKVQGSSRQVNNTATRFVNIGGIERPVVEGGLHIPYGKPLPAEGWEFQCTAVGEAINSFRVGRRWRVVSVPLDDATARRLDVVEVPT